MDADLDTIRDLLRRHGSEMFDCMVQVAKSSPRDSISSSARSFVSTTTSTSRTTASSLSCYPDSASIGRGQVPWYPPNPNLRANLSRTSTPVDPSPIESTSIYSNHTSHSQVKESEQEGSGDGSKSKLQCPFCMEFGVDTRIGRKPDLKRHFNKFHATNAQWICKFNIAGGCNLFFDFNAAYEAHVKQDHAGMKDPDAKVNLCQQVVFACGFEQCREVFEAKTDQDGPDTLNCYFEHVLNHIMSSSCDSWTYSRRIRNLLHQEHVRTAWKECDKGSGRELHWRPQSSGILRKMLECRHIPDILLLCRYAARLGDSRYSAPVPPKDFKTPLLNTCTMISPCHDPDLDERFQRGGVKARKRVAYRTSNSQLTGVPVLHSIPSHTVMSSTGQQPDLFYTDVFHPGSAPIPFDTSSFTMGNAENVILPQYNQAHPLHLFAGSASLGEPPSQHQVITDIENTLEVTDLSGQHKASSKLHSPFRGFQRHRSRRNSSPDSDCRMGDSPPPLPTVFPAPQHAQVTRRRSSGAMDTFFNVNVVP